MYDQMDREVREYTYDEITNIIGGDGIQYEQCTFLCALTPFVLAGEAGTSSITYYPTVEVIVIQDSNHQTGYMSVPGKKYVVVINEDSSVMDYDLISAIHPMKDAEVYLWLSEPWSADSPVPLGIHGEWYRRDVYPDGMVTANCDSLGWEDQAPTEWEN